LIGLTIFLVEQALDRVLALVDDVELERRAQEPLPQLNLACPGFGQVHHPEQRGTLARNILVHRSVLLLGEDVERAAASRV
jgi:hypothetical protein